MGDTIPITERETTESENTEETKSENIEYYQISFGYEKDNLTLEGISIYNNIVADEFDKSKEEN